MGFVRWQNEVRIPSTPITQLKESQSMFQAKFCKSSTILMDFWTTRPSSWFLSPLSRFFGLSMTSLFALYAPQGRSVKASGFSYWNVGPSGSRSAHWRVHIWVNIYILMYIFMYIYLYIQSRLASFQKKKCWVLGLLMYIFVYVYIYICIYIYIYIWNYRLLCCKVSIVLMDFWTTRSGSRFLSPLTRFFCLSMTSLFG